MDNPNSSQQQQISTPLIGWFRFLISYGLVAYSAYNIIRCIDFIRTCIIYISHNIDFYYNKAQLTVFAYLGLRVFLSFLAISAKNLFTAYPVGRNYNRALSRFYLLHIGELIATYLIAVFYSGSWFDISFSSHIIPSIIIVLSLLLNIQYFKRFLNSGMLSSHKCQLDNTSGKIYLQKKNYL